MVKVVSTCGNQKAKSMGVNPQMGTNTLWLRGVPKCEIFCLPPPFHTGTPHMVTGTVF